MKLIKIFYALSLVILLSLQINAQYTTNAQVTDLKNGKVITFVIAAPDTGAAVVYNSNSFSLNNYDNDSWATTPLNFIYKLTSAVGTPKISCYVQGSADASTWPAAGTYIDTLLSSATSETLTRATADFNDLKYPYYRLVIKAIKTANIDQVGSFWIYAHKKDSE